MLEFQTQKTKTWVDLGIILRSLFSSLNPEYYFIIYERFSILHGHHSTNIK